ncbi:MAG: radical SAM protein [Bdellovibrio sp.]|nr:radical SAM protein [Bdellovibrio sp.]
MEIRRQNDIVAFRVNGEAPLAFHARNLEVAEISEELWNHFSHIEANELQDALTEWNNEENPAVKSGKASMQIRSLTINVTQICNLKCTYCAAGGDGTYGAPQTKISVEKTLPQLKYFLEQLSNEGTFRITFLGGEPLLYPEGIRAIANYVTLMTAGRNLRPEFSIVTNGTLFSDSNIQLLTDIGCNITVSVDGDSQINDQVRPMKNGQSTSSLIAEGLQKVFAAKELLGMISLHGVFTAENMNVVEAYNFYRQFPADKYEFTYGVSELDEATNSKFISEMELIASQAYQDLGEDGLRQIGFFRNVFAALDEQRRTENFCGAGKSFLVVDAKNNLFTCPWDVGQKQEQVGQGAELNKAELEKYSDSLINQHNCHTCWARYLCGGGCMFIHKQGTGSKHTKNKQFCARMQSLLSIALLYYKKCRDSASEVH